jgi:hypothetical protein
MTVGKRWFGVLGVAAMTAILGACSGPVRGDAATVDSAYGIPPNTVPQEEMRPDGLMINGLLPLPPNSGS